MGGNNSMQLSVAALNYSGIYLNPFQYYGLDNWQQLQSIGILFQKNLRREYHSIRQIVRAKDSKQFEEEEYSRDTFKWDIGSIDKDIHVERYSPLYCSEENIKNMKFAGISFQNGDENLQTKEEFLKSWGDAMNNLIKWSSDILEYKAKTAKNSKQTELFQCSMLDFLSYEAIIEYIYNTKQSKGMFRAKKNQNYQKIITLVNGFKPSQRINAIKKYKQFMKRYFQLINVDTKIQLTIKQLFINNKLDIVFFAEATPNLRLKLKQLNYYLYAPAQSDPVKQCIVMIKKGIKIIPEEYIYKQMDEGVEIRNKFDKYIQQFSQNSLMENVSTKHKQFQILINKFSNQKFKNPLKDVISQSNKTISQVQQSFKDILDNSQTDLLRKQIEKQLSVETKSFYKTWLEIIQSLHFKQKEMKSAKTFLNDLKDKGILFWGTDLTCVKYQLPRKTIIIVGVHLSSKPQCNLIQIQIMGLMIKYFEQQNYSYIIGGDFNSYVSVHEDQQNKFGLFHYVNQVMGNDLFKKLAKNVRIYPRNKKMITTKKKRTILQPQIRKVNDLVQKCIDQIITNLPCNFQDSSIGQIYEIGKQIRTTHSFLPHLKHPYDHLLVQSKIRINTLFQF